MLLVVKIKLILAAAALASPLAVAAVAPRAPAVFPPELVTLAPATFQHRPAGDFSRDGRPAVAPRVATRLTQPLHIMTRPVSAGDYLRCVEAGACPAMDGEPAADVAAVRISWRDAAAYAEWLSRETGANFRLPTDEEWAFAAGSRFHDEGMPDVAGDDPARRWLARYEAEAGRESAGKALRPIGSFGVNENGLYDVAGNVWEWTNSCFRRVVLSGAEAGTVLINCGVRVVEGQHRTYVTDFVRDARAGGCAVGTPPAHLGFRLVREDRTRWDAIRVLVRRHVALRLGLGLGFATES